MSIWSLSLGVSILLFTLVMRAVTHRRCKGRLWRLSFFIGTSSKWFLGLYILEHSPPTWVDSRLIIDEPPPLPPTSSTPAPSLIDAPIPSTSHTPQRGRLTKPKPSISMRLRPAHELYPIRNEKPSSASDMFGISVALDDNSLASSLQYE